MPVDFFAAGEGILRGLKPGLLRACYHQGSRFNTRRKPGDCACVPREISELDSLILRESAEAPSDWTCTCPSRLAAPTGCLRLSNPLPQPHLPNDRLESGMIPKNVPLRLHFQEHHVYIPFVVGCFQTIKGSIQTA